MRKILKFGNSGSGKSTLAEQLRAQERLAHLDLDTLAWLAESPPRRAPIAISGEKIQQFMDEHEAWVIDGCYSDLLALASEQATEAIFMDLPLPMCIENAQGRPWEPHKYESKQAQDTNLAMLLDWISQYTEREDEFSHSAHVSFYEGFEGRKTRVTKNQ
jgi:adenylate kinase family enzyme